MNTITRTGQDSIDRYVADILNDIPIDLKRSLFEYLSDNTIFTRLLKKLENNAVSIESEKIRITLFSAVELMCLMDLLKIDFATNEVQELQNRLAVLHA
jgi:hypothetical protein